MKKPINILVWILVIQVLSSCSLTRNSVSDKTLKFSLQGGFNVGGITENTDMSVVPNVRVPTEANVDAFSGATQVGYNAGFHVNKKLKNNQIESGLDYMFDYQTFNYIDAGNFYIGVRRLQVSQFMLPLTFNLTLFGNLFPKAEVQLKIGFIGQANFISTNDTGISLPDYSVKPYSFGPTFGLSVYPFQFNNGNKLGCYLDGYRGNQIYEDYYNQPGFEMPGSSFLKFGFRYQFN